MDIKQNITNRDVWLRGLFIVIFGVILYFAFILVWLLVVFQFVSKVVTGNLNRQLADFSSGLLRYISQILGISLSSRMNAPSLSAPGPKQTRPRPRRRPRQSPDVAQPVHPPGKKKTASELAG